MSSCILIAILLLERIAIAVIGLIAAINGQTAWSIFMAIILVILICSTKIRVPGRKE